MYTINFGLQEPQFILILDELGQLHYVEMLHISGYKF